MILDAGEPVLQGSARPVGAHRRHVDRQPQLLGLQSVHHPARARGEKSEEAQKGVIFAAYLKLLMPVIIVLPGIAAVMLAPDLARPDEAYPTMMRLLPSGIAGLVFAALIAAIIASTASKINSIATIFTLDIYNKFGAPKSETQLVTVGRIAATRLHPARHRHGAPACSAASIRHSSTSRSTPDSSRPASW